VSTAVNGLEAEGHDAVVCKMEKCMTNAFVLGTMVGVLADALGVGLIFTAVAQMKRQRMAEDKEFLGNPSRWPYQSTVHLKTQSWIKPQRFGTMDIGPPYRVIDKTTRRIRSLVIQARV
jgi:hypothetical protein